MQEGAWRALLIVASRDVPQELTVQRLIRSILEVRRDPVTRPVMKATLRDAIKEREKIRRAGWWN